ncbi:MAG: AbrB/MazE/SpoVT family DNA-binding domain-containing protein [Nanoarchaeota archaeon]
MVQFEVGKISSKGQVVIPVRLRGKYKEGDSIIFIEEGNTLIIKREADADINFKEDLEFARRTEEAWKRHDRGEFKRMEVNEFLKEMKKW